MRLDLTAARLERWLHNADPCYRASDKDSQLDMKFHGTRRIIIYCKSKTSPSPSSLKDWEADRPTINPQNSRGSGGVWWLGVVVGFGSGVGGGVANFQKHYVVSFFFFFFLLLFSHIPGA